MILKVAVLEDDAELREQILVPELRNAGFDVEGYAASGELFAAMPTRVFDLLVLDIGLPDVDGFTVAQRLREEWPIGIVVLTGRRAAADQIRGLTEAADSWLVKPIDVDVLAATLHSLARRMRMPLRADDAPARWRLSPEGWRLHGPDGRGLALNHLERRLLGRLFETPEQVVPHGELIHALVNSAEDIDMHRLEMLIHRLRRKVAAELGRPLPLRSVRSQGYLMLVDDERSAER